MLSQVFSEPFNDINSGEFLSSRLLQLLLCRGIRPPPQRFFPSKYNLQFLDPTLHASVCFYTSCRQRFINIGSNISSNASDINRHISKVKTAMNRLSTIRKSHLSVKLRLEFIQTEAVSELLYGCTTWTLRKCLEKKLDWYYKSILRVFLNEPWKQKPLKQYYPVDWDGRIHQLNLCRGVTISPQQVPLIWH